MFSSFISPVPALHPKARRFTPSTSSLRPRKPTRTRALPPAQPPCASANQSQDDAPELWNAALEELFLELLRTYYEGMPMLTDSEFQTLRDELQYLGNNQLRLHDMEKIWVQATSARDFDRRVREEFQVSEEQLRSLKNKLLHINSTRAPAVDKRNHARNMLGASSSSSSATRECDAQRIDADTDVEERLKWFFFSDANEERLKILLLYLPAVLMSFVTASVLTILFALLDGEMTITVSTAGRFRLGILSYLVVMLTIYISNQVTPLMLDYLDLGQPTLLRGECPTCKAPVSCLFTGAVRVRDERVCAVCSSTVGFNRRWSKIYLVAQPGGESFHEPD